MWQTFSISTSFFEPAIGTTSLPVNCFWKGPGSLILSVWHEQYNSHISYVVFTTAVVLLATAKISNFLEGSFPEIILCMHATCSAREKAFKAINLFLSTISLSHSFSLSLYHKKMWWSFATGTCSSCVFTNSTCCVTTEFSFLLAGTFWLGPGVGWQGLIELGAFCTSYWERDKALLICWAHTRWIRPFGNPATLCSPLNAIAGTPPKHGSSPVQMTSDWFKLDLSSPLLG